MKIGIVGDIHLGFTTTKAPITHAVTNGQYAALEAIFSDFEAKGVETLVFVGDIFENRRFIASEVLDYAYRMFKNRLAGFQCYVIAGNHDMLYDNSSDVCNIRMLENLDNVHVYIDGVGVAELDGRNWFFVPWIQEDKMEKVNKWLIKESRGDISKNVIVGHFDMIGARMEAKTVSTAGFDPKRFLNAAQLTISGHYHCRSTIESGDSQVCYVGTPYQLSFGHVGIPAGYHIYEDGELTFYKNNVSPEFIDVVDTELGKYSDLTNKIVRYYVDKNRSFDEAALLKATLADMHPVYIDQVPYGEDPDTEENEDAPKTEEEARQIMTTDSVGMAEMYLDKHPEILPELNSGEDAKMVTLAFIREYNAKIK